MARVVMGLVQSHDSSGKVLVLGRPETVEQAAATWATGDPEQTEFVTTPRFDTGWVPPVVVELGNPCASTHDGPFLEFDPGVEEALRVVLDCLGFEVQRDDAQISRAEGY